MHYIQTLVFESCEKDVTLYSLDRQLDGEGEIQSELEWKTRTIIDAQDLPKLFYYAKIHFIKLTKQDLRSSRPLYTAKLYQLQFHLKIKVNSKFFIYLFYS